MKNIILIGGLGTGEILLILVILIILIVLLVKFIARISKPKVKDEPLPYAGELEKLHQLYKKGVLTQEEFEAEKKKVLK